MSGKRAKRERKMFKELDKLLPIMEEAQEQLDHDEELIAKWATVAVVMHNLEPSLPLQNLLPDVLDKTIALLSPKLEVLLGGLPPNIDQIVNTPN